MVEHSLRTYGAGRSILVDKDGTVIAGNKTLEAAADIGLPVRVIDTEGDELVVVRRKDLDLASGGKARELAYIDNRSSQVGLEWDIEQIASDLAEGVNFDDMFFEDELKETLGDLWLDDEPPEDPGAEIDKAEELRVKWGVESGQLWQLGEHRLICGDCTDAAVVDRVMGGERAEMVFTDPPYNALKSWDKDEAKGETRLDPSKWFENDNMEWADYIDFLENAWTQFPKPHSVYVCCDFRIYNIIVSSLFEQYYNLKHCIVWKKNVWGLGKRYRFQHEFIVYAVDEGAPFYGNREQSDVWEVDVIRNKDLHNTPKPVMLPLIAIENSSMEGGKVYDGFLGSGATLIACERLNRKCRAVEISPAYCAVAIERWHQMTGEMPEIITP
jgi:DNA modification methylase